jgi:ribosomal protein S18 acetylase RimI-like enzyme
MPALKTTKAVFSDDPEICVVARQSPYTRDFTSHRFFRANIESDYAKGFVGVCKNPSFGVVGFVYCKHLIRKPMSVIHYMGVEKEWRGNGVGRALLAWALKNSPHDRVELSCEDRNTSAMKFYEHSRLEMIGSGFYGKEPRLRTYTRWMMFRFKR